MKNSIICALVCSSMLTPVFACGPERCESYFFNDRKAYSKLSIDGFELDFKSDSMTSDFSGVVMPQMSILYLWAAYRSWSGQPLLEAEMKILDQSINDLAPNASLVKDFLDQKNRQQQEKNGVSDIESWRLLIEKLFPDSGPYYPGIYRSVMRQKDGVESHLYFENCSNDAFRQAASKLNSLLNSKGAHDPSVIQWAKNQRRVFENCIEQEQVLLPEKGASSLTQKEQQDYAYQVASSYFYAMDYQKSAHLFEQIVEDTSSPDRVLAAYLVLRSHYRNCVYHAADPNLFIKAFEDHKHLLSATSYGQEAEKLMRRLKVMLNPDKAIQEISSTLEGRSGKITEQTLKDFVYLYKTEPSLMKGTPFLDWIQAYRNPNGFDDAYKRWKENPTILWLIASIGVRLTEKPLPNDLLIAAQNIDASSPAYLTVRYVLARYYSHHDPLKAHKIIDEVVDSQALQPAVQNRFLALRARTATTFDTFYEAVIQKPVMTTCNQPSSALRDFDEGNGHLLNQLSRSMLEKVQKDGRTPVWLQQQIAGVLFVRSVLFNDSAQALTYLVQLSHYDAQFSEHLQEIEKETNQKRQNILMLRHILQSPGLSVWLSPFHWREEVKNYRDIDKFSGFRDNWWREEEFNVNFEALPFLSEQEKKNALKEWETLTTISKQGFVDYCCKKTLEWFALSPDDPILPELMHLCVRLSRYMGIAPVSSLTVYQKLHTHFKNSPYAKTTPYHYYVKPKTS